MADLIKLACFCDLTTVVKVVANSDKAWRDTRHAKSADEFDQDVFDDEVTKYHQAEDSDKVLLLNWYDRKETGYRQYQGHV